VTVGDVPLKAEAVEQRLLHIRRSPIIDRISCTSRKESAHGAAIKQSFSTQFANTGHSLSTWRTGQVNPNRALPLLRLQKSMRQKEAQGAMGVMRQERPFRERVATSERRPQKPRLNCSS
jgi:hypothetical protein